MRDRLEGIEVFVETVEAGGFARAAVRLSLTRSAVAKTISRLEARLGVRLFHRTTRAQSLTEDGQIYYERSHRALAELRAGEFLIQSGQKDIIGRVKVSMPALLGRYCVAPLLVEMARAHPLLELELSFSDEPTHLIADGVDLAIRLGSLGSGDGLVARKLAMQQKILCAAPGYLQRRGRPNRVSDLSEHEALVYLRNGQDYGWLLPDGEGRHVEAALKSRLRFDNHEAILDAAVAGMGIAWTPSWLARSRLARGDLETVLPDLPPVSIDIYAIWPSADHLPLRLRAMIDRLATDLPKSVDGAVAG
jgi:DNA-binding transcriptional LysR family regulator